MVMHPYILLYKTLLPWKYRRYLALAGGDRDKCHETLLHGTYYEEYDLYGFAGEKSNSTVAYLYSFELDIMEMTGGAGLRDYQAIPAVHWQSKESGKPAMAGGRDHLHTHDRPLCEDFHIYAVEWDAKSMAFYFDDLLIFTCDVIPDMQGAFDRPHSIILNTSLEHWDENTCPNEDTDLPQDYIIDYIRVYQEE